MKARIAHGPVKQKLLISLLFFFISIIGLSIKTNAQGWTFTFSVAQSGPCAAYVPLVIPPLPNFGIPTQSQCESLRQTLLAIKSSIPEYNDQGVYIGDCSAYVTCTPCTGSDIVTPGQVSPGDVSFDGQFQGKPLFTTHESSAFEDWSRDYRQQLASYGITSILGNTLTPPNIPLTGDPGLDALYKSQSENFNPTTAPVVTPPPSDASVVDLSGKQGVVKLLRSPEDIKSENDWLQQQKLDNLKPIPKYGDLDPIVLEEDPFWTSPDMVSLEIAAVGFAVPFAIALVPAAAIGASAATAEMLATPVLTLLSEDYKAVIDVNNGKTPQSFGTTMINTGKSFFIDTALKKVDGGLGNLVKNPDAKDIISKLPGLASTAYSYLFP
ncbi:MAG: hypothetical protein WC780_15880 [Lentimicrobiaceae bacterium]|jgi:hypothetical protein